MPDHRSAEVVVAQGLVSEALAVTVDGDQAGQSDRPQVRKEPLLAVEVLEHGHRGPGAHAEHRIVDVPAGTDRQGGGIPAVAHGRREVVVAVGVVREVLLPQFLVAGEAAGGEDHAEPRRHRGGMLTADHGACDGSGVVAGQ